MIYCCSACFVWCHPQPAGNPAGRVWTSEQLGRTPPQAQQIGISASSQALWQAQGQSFSLIVEIYSAKKE